MSHNQPYRGVHHVAGDITLVSSRDRDGAICESKAELIKPIAGSLWFVRFPKDYDDRGRPVTRARWVVE